MNDDPYWFISRKEWNSILREMANPNPFRYQTLAIPLRKAKQLKPVYHVDTNGYQSIVEHCLMYPENCHDLTAIFDFLANQYGAGHYLKTTGQQCKVLVEGLHQYQAVYR